ncbi:MAG: SRPBCC family protein [Deltaproteobacteria bacterium]|nr:SRPBCC family protein [Deltaproteobacteria bacterium]
MKKTRWGLLAVVIVGAAVLGLRYYQVRTAALRWEGPVPEILSEKLDKQADTMEIEFTSRIDAPPAAVLRAFTEPERSADFSNIVRYSKLLQSEGNRKVVEFEMVILGQPQRFTLEFTFLPEERRVTVKTVESQFSDLNGEYRLTPSPDGTKTLLTYSGTSRDKVKLPVPLAFQKSALRETFVSTLQALKKGLAAQRTGDRGGGRGEAFADVTPHLYPHCRANASPLRLSALRFLHGGCPCGQQVVLMLT